MRTKTSSCAVCPRSSRVTSRNTMIAAAQVLWRCRSSSIPGARWAGSRPTRSGMGKSRKCDPWKTKEIGSEEPRTRRWRVSPHQVLLYSFVRQPERNGKAGIVAAATQDLGETDLGETLRLDGRDHTIRAVESQQNRACNRNRRNTRDLPRGKPFPQRARLTLSAEIGDLR